MDGVRSLGHVLQVHNNYVIFFCTNEGSEVAQPFGFFYLLHVGGVSILLVHCFHIHPPDPQLSPFQKHPCFSVKHRNNIFVMFLHALTQKGKNGQVKIVTLCNNPRVKGLLKTQTLKLHSQLQLSTETKQLELIHLHCLNNSFST